MIKLSSIKPNPNNPRTIKDEKFDKLVKSIREFPKMMALRPMVVDKDGILLGGNMRYKALVAIGYTEIDESWVRRAEDLTPEEINRFVIVDNVSFGEFDWAILEDWNQEELEEWGLDIEFSEPEKEVEEDNYEAEVPEIPRTKKGDLYHIGEHKLLCGDSTKKEEWAKIMGSELCDMVMTDPPYNVDYEGGTGMKIMNDKMGDKLFYQFLKDFYTSLVFYTKKGGAWYVWHAETEGMNFRSAMANTGIMLKQCLIWVKNSLVMGRQDYQWKHEPCQPAGTKIATPDGYVNIEDLKDGDKVTSFDTYSGQVKGYREGLEIKTASREYDGIMYEVNVEALKTKATDNHEFSVRFKANKKNTYCTYLMRKGNRWRTGVTKTYMSRGFGLKDRIRMELSDEAWILQTYETAKEARTNEHINAIKYGIPMTIWTAERGIALEKGHRTTVEIDQIYEALDPEKMEQNATKLLIAHGRNRNHPLINKENQGAKFSTRVTTKVKACNLITGIMELPIPYSQTKKDDGSTFEWRQITAINKTPFKGTVYSLSVDKYEHYIADGIVTHNCLYGWVEGGTHYFTDERTHTTVIEDIVDLDKMKKAEMKELLEIIMSDQTKTSVIHCDRPTRSDLHPTMKPILLLAPLIKNSSRRNEIVGDGFLGSGSTMVASHQLNRRCYGMELDPKFCDVIIDRMLKLDPDLIITKNGEDVTAEWLGEPEDE